jgi:putative ABC transport system substrate-binding protein
MFRKYSLITAVLLFCLLRSIAFADAPRVVVLKSADIAPYNESVKGFKKTCKCSIEEISLADTETENLNQNILDKNPDLLLAVGVDALSHALSIKDIPVVYSMVPNLSLIDLSGRRLSGVSMYIPPEKYLNAIIELFPSAKRIGVVYDPKQSGKFIKDAEYHAKSRGLELVQRLANKPGEVFSLIDSLRNRIDLLLMLPDLTVVNSETFKYMLAFSFQNGLPVFTFANKYVEMGAAAGLNASPHDMGLQAGEIVKRILIDKNITAPIRVDPNKTGLIVNDRILKKLGTDINSEAVRRAGHVQ